ncbi:MAG: hypothetical protein B6D41_13235 [Chloroflexi bacterium UTCFX4]|nr:MAG: hypothetical protein B6D41_13235 [Chloroflexi bacterium UTCFX4]
MACGDDAPEPRDLFYPDRAHKPNPPDDRNSILRARRLTRARNRRARSQTRRASLSRKKRLRCI